MDVLVPMKDLENFIKTNDTIELFGCLVKRDIFVNMLKYRFKDYPSETCEQCFNKTPPRCGRKEKE